MIDYAGMVAEFHEKHGAFTAKHPAAPPEEVAILRLKLIDEEFLELLQAERDGDLVQVADALADLLYVVFGTALAFGLPIDEIFEEVHRSNMTKDAVQTTAGQKVQKGPSFKEPDLLSILNRRRD